MSITQSEYDRLKDTVDRRQKQAERAKGALQQAMKRLKDEFGVDSIQAGQALLATLTEDEKKAAKIFEKKYAEFREKWEDTLEHS